MDLIPPAADSETPGAHQSAAAGGTPGGFETPGGRADTGDRPDGGRGEGNPQDSDRRDGSLRDGDLRGGELRGGDLRGGAERGVAPRAGAPARSAEAPVPGTEAAAPSADVPAPSGEAHVPSGEAHARRAEALALAPLLNCLVREVAVPLPPSAGRPAYRLPTGRELRVRGTRRPAAPEVRAPGDATWRSLDHDALVAVAAEELRARTGVDHPGLPAEMRDSRHVLEALLAAREGADEPADPYLRSEQSLLTGHPYHPAPKTRGGGAPPTWLPYAPEAYARFPLTLLAVREDQVVEEGDTTALDTLGEAPPGYRLLPAHPWQLALLGDASAPAFADGRLVRVGGTPEAWWPTAAVRTVYAPERDLFLKFSLDVRITNDVRRLWRHDLLRLRRVDAAVSRAFAADDVATAGRGRSGWLSDRGYRTAAFAFEELAVMVRDGLHTHVAPGATPLLAAALAEGFDGDPLAAATDPARWWEAYLSAVVPPALTAFARHGVVVEAHLQNTLVTVAADGTPVQALYRDAEGVKLVPETGRAAGWERLVYCLVVNHLLEIAAALTEHHPGLDPWPPLRAELARHAVPEAQALLTAPTLPGKTNLLLRWTDADGADARYLPLANVLRSVRRGGL